MTINLIYPYIPAPLDRHIPGTSITACSILSNLAISIKQQPDWSAKDTPSASVCILSDYIEHLTKRLATQSRNHPASANLNIILQLGASIQDGRWHTASGWTAEPRPSDPQSDQLSDLLILQALKTLGRTAIATEPSRIPQRNSSLYNLLTASTAPTIITTNLYLDNRHNAAILRSSEGIQRLASIHTLAITEYLKLSQ